MGKYSLSLPESDLPNSNGMVFSKEAIEKAVQKAQDSIKNGNMLVHCDAGSRVDLDKVVGVVRELSLEDGKMVIEVEKIERHPASKMLDLVKFSPRGFKNGDDFEIVSIGIEPK